MRPISATVEPGASSRSIPCEHRPPVARRRSRRPRSRSRPGPGGSGLGAGRVGDLLGLVDHLEEALSRGGRALRLPDPHAEHPQRHHEHRQEQVEGEEAAERADRRARPCAPPRSAPRAWASDRQEREQRHVERALACSRARSARRRSPEARSNCACRRSSCANDLTTWTPTIDSSATVATSRELLLDVAQHGMRDVAVAVRDRRRSAA